MNCPTPKDFSDAVRTPAPAFADPDLAAGSPVIAPDGEPLALTGDSSVVYRVRGADGRNWAVKCFAGSVSGLARRHARIQEALDRSAPPFAVEFVYREDGIRVGGRGFPVLKMEWVDGLPLNRVALCDPAALDALFGRWVRLCRQLREARVAHGDLQHGNVLLVPGARPGTYAIKLIDYDGMYVPALAGSPPGEAGHPNYQHPARTAEDYSPDLDRFPLLVVATALKGLAVLGPRLWDRYDTGDNLLFTATDFQDPAGSALMRELWRTNHPTLQTLVGSLAVACGRPMAQTPWLDDLAPDGLAVPLSAAQSRDSAAALGLVPVATSPAAAPPPARPAAESRPVVPPRKRLTARAAVVAGFLMILGGAVAGIVSGLLATPDEPDRARRDEPQPPNGTRPQAPRVATAPPPRPVPPVVALAPAPRPRPPAFAGPPGFYRVWSKSVAEQRGFVRVTFAADGRSVFHATNGRVELFDAKTGESKRTLQGVPLISQQVWALDGDRVAVFGHPLKAPAVWDAKTGEPLPPLLAQNPLPPPDTPVSGAECQLSPDGKFLFIGNQGAAGGAFGPAQYRVVEVATGKALAGGEWRFGSARFTADNAKMLMVESTGRVRWVKIPSGEVEVEWAFPQIIATHILAGMSADGSLVNYFGRPGNLPLGNYLLDGKTGQVLRKLAHGTGLGRSVVTADGRWVVAILSDAEERRPSAVVADARTGAFLVRTPVGADVNDVVQADFTPDGKSVIVHDRGKHEIAVYELRGEVPAVPEGVRVPEPLTPVPERVAPGAPMAVVPADPAPPRPKRGLPEAPPFKPRWTVATETGIMANQLPQAALYSKDGKTMILSGGDTGTILTFDAKTGAAGAAFDGHKTSKAGVYWLVPFADRVVSGGFDAKRATWDIKTGKRVDEVKFPELPPMPAGQNGHAGITYAVSPTGRYAAAARKEAGRPVVPGPLRILDTTTGKEVVQADWNGGHIAFTADESRVFVLDGLGKATWYKLPSGEADGGWRTGAGAQAEFARVLGMTADGKTILYHGTLPGGAGGVCLLDGKTGEVIRKLGGAPYQASFSALSPDGKYVVMSVIDFDGGNVWYADVFEVATWRPVGRLAPPAKGGNGPAQFSFSPDGKELSVFYPSAKQLGVFPLPE